MLHIERVSGTTAHGEDSVNIKGPEASSPDAASNPTPLKALEHGSASKEVSYATQEKEGPVLSQSVQVDKYGGISSAILHLYTGCWDLMDSVGLLEGFKVRDGSGGLLEIFNRAPKKRPVLLLFCRLGLR